MALTIGIVGLPNAGKSTLFNALTRNDVLAANYPFATIEPNVGVVGVPEPRLAVLGTMYRSERLVPATVSFVDIAGIVKGASQGEGMGNAFLANIREADAICQVTRAFVDEDVTHVDGAVNPGSDIETVTTELILADLQTLEKALPRVEKEARIKKETRPKLEAMLAAQKVLDAGQTIFASGMDTELLRDLFLLTAKPFIYVFNCDQDELANEDLKESMRAVVAPAEAIFLDAKFESELVEMDADEAREFLAEMGVTEPGLDQLARVGYATLGLQSFLTAGPKESRAWTIKKGATAPEAAGVIHTDFQKGFIKAQIVTYDDLVALGSEAAAKAAGKLRLEGKDYVMSDGDVVEFRFNVKRSASLGQRTAGPVLAGADVLDDMQPRRHIARCRVAIVHLGHERSVLVFIDGHDQSVAMHRVPTFPEHVRWQRTKGGPLVVIQVEVRACDLGGPRAQPHLVAELADGGSVGLDDLAESQAGAVDMSVGDDLGKR